MASARHFLARGSISDTDLKNDIQADITAARGAQRDLQATGQHAAATRMGEQVDAHLDEYTAANNGTWTPKHV